MTDTQRPWDRLTTDSDPAYKAFAAYLDTGSLRDAYRQRSGNEKATPSHRRDSQSASARSRYCRAPRTSGARGGCPACRGSPPRPCGGRAYKAVAPRHTPARRTRRRARAARPRPVHPAGRTGSRCRATYCHFDVTYRDVLEPIISISRGGYRRLGCVCKMVFRNGRCLKWWS